MTPAVTNGLVSWPVTLWAPVLTGLCCLGVGHRRCFCDGSSCGLVVVGSIGHLERAALASTQVIPILWLRKLRHKEVK